MVDEQWQAAAKFKSKSPRDVQSHSQGNSQGNAEQAHPASVSDCHFGQDHGKPKVVPMQKSRSPTAIFLIDIVELPAWLRPVTFKEDPRRSRQSCGSCDDNLLKTVVIKKIRGVFQVGFGAARLVESAS